MVKDMLTSHQVLSHYNPDLPLIVTADASLVGVGAVLAHIVPGAQPGKTREIPTSYTGKDLLSYLELKSSAFTWPFIGLQLLLITNPCLAYLLLTARDLRLLSPRDIARATDSDVVLRQVKIYIHQGWPSTVPTELLPFYSKRAALSLHSECSLWHEHVMIPSALQENAITNKVKLHQACQTVANAPSRSIVCPWPRAESAWERVHQDYTGPFLRHYLLIVINAYSK
ncbi:hypothetical protein PR048_011569 [Dryococelus australis]|uniref:Reverse transcriptase/retrotransposon-derived protein RNase H-like domain-containing protein n=1 Tax=Dryococelus australis TaxID=614101 RepID=A0ABQ9HM26_9NEOP|nr:hypothetical protein PR048_011569 [Dryococelus australis]